MKLIDGDKLLSDLYQKVVRSYDVGDTVVKYKDVIIHVREYPEISKTDCSYLPAEKHKDYNGYTRCSFCLNRIYNKNAKYCDNCGRKFID